jgi:hypothetical protein
MRMFNKSLISVSALLALGALGCGDNAEETPAPVNQPDSGVSGGGGMDAGININGCNTLPIVGSVKLCMQPNGQNGYQTCVGGVAQGAFNPISFGGDGGATQLPFDGGFTLTDGGIKIGDATIPLDSGLFTGPCPAPFQCNTTLGAFASLVGAPPGGGVCTKDTANIFSADFQPPACTASGQCDLGAQKGMCIANPLEAGKFVCLKGCSQ